MSDADRITELEAEVQALRRALEAQDKATASLIAVQHRTRNLIASIRSIAAQTADHGRDLEDFTAHFDGRLGALARCQSILNRSSDLRVDFEELVREELLAQGMASAERIRLEGPVVRVGARTGEALALALHELATNAVKFGALSNNDGVLDLRWRDDEGTLVIDWIERGAPVRLQRDRDGFGRQLIEYGLPFQLGARTFLDFLHDGVHGHIATAIAETQAGSAP